MAQKSQSSEPRDIAGLIFRSEVLNCVVSFKTLNRRGEQGPTFAPGVTLTVFICLQQLPSSGSKLVYQSSSVSSLHQQCLAFVFLYLFFNLSCITPPSHRATSLISFLCEGQRDNFSAQKRKLCDYPLLKWMQRTLENPRYKCLASKSIVLLHNPVLYVQSEYHTHPFLCYFYN